MAKPYRVQRFVVRAFYFKHNTFPWCPFFAAHAGMDKFILSLLHPIIRQHFGLLKHCINGFLLFVRRVSVFI